MAVERRLLNADDRCRLLRGELPTADALARSDRLTTGRDDGPAHGWRTTDDVEAAMAVVDDVERRDGDGRRNRCSNIRFSSRTASGGGSSSGP